MTWITARAALDRDAQRQGANLVDLAADGLVRTKAAALTVGRADPQRDVELTAGFWRAMQKMTGSAYRDWVTGSFRTQITSDIGVMPVNAQRAMGVTFEQDDLDQYLPAPSWPLSLAPSPASSPAPTAAVPNDLARPRGRPRAAGWDLWIAQLALAVNDGDVKPDMLADRLIDHLNERLTKAGHEEMARSTVQSAVDAVLTAFRADAER